jgi:hypothetical protein
LVTTSCKNVRVVAISDRQNSREDLDAEWEKLHDFGLGFNSTKSDDASVVFGSFLPDFGEVDAVRIPVFVNLNDPEVVAFYDESAVVVDCKKNGFGFDRTENTNILRR